MNSRSKMTSFWCLAAMAVAMTSAAAAKPRNVLMIVVDDLNTSLSCYGSPVKSPNIDRLAARGVRFANAHCQYPLCNPSRVSFLTGMRPEVTGVYRLTISAHDALPNAVTLPRYFRQNGYYTAGAGKVFHNLRTNDEGAWDHYEDGEGENAQEIGAIKARYGGGDGRPAWVALDGDGGDTRDGLNAKRIAGLLAERGPGATPFFLAAGFHKPHLPWTAPRRFFEIYPVVGVTPDPAMEKIPAIALQTELSGFEQPSSREDAIRAYYACVSFTDAQIGRLLAELDRQDLWSNTVVVLLGDNGFHLGDHGGLWAKLSLFGAATRVPLIFAGAGVPSGRVVTKPVELLDIYPTLLALAGLPRSDSLQGRSLTPLMQGEDAAPRFAFSMVYHYDVAARRDVGGRTVIGEDFRFTSWDNGRFRELYDERTDAGGYRNLAGAPDRADVEKRAQSLLLKLPEPKPGAANRPRGLASGPDRVN